DPVGRQTERPPAAHELPRDIEVAALGDDERQASRDTHHPQRRDERRELDEDDQQGAEATGRHAGRERGNGGCAQTPAGVDEEPATDDAGERDDRAWREVDSARDDDHRGTDRGNAVDGRVLQDQQRVRTVEERMCAIAVGPQIPGEEQNLRDEYGDGAEFTNVLHAALVSAVASRMTASSVASAPTSWPWTRPSRMTITRWARASTSGRSLETTRHAVPRAASRRMTA